MSSPTLDVAMIRTLFAHFTWSRDRILDAATAVPVAHLRESTPGGYGSIHDTLVHMAASEWMWLERIAGRSPTAFPSGADTPDLAAIRAWWDTVQAATQTYLVRLDSAELGREIQYHNTQGRPFTRRVWHVLLHVANHQTEHRAQIADALTRLGVEAPATDLVVFLTQVASSPIPNAITPRPNDTTPR